MVSKEYEDVMLNFRIFSTLIPKESNVNFPQFLDISF